MKSSTANLIPGILLLMTAILSGLNVNFNDYDWLDILPAILFGVAGIAYIFEFYKNRKEEAQNE